MHPTRASLDDGDLSDDTLGTLDEFVTQMNQTNEAHFLMSGRINVEADRSLYPLDNFANFGRGRYLYTMDSTDVNHRRHAVQLVPYEGLTDFYGGGDPLLASVPGDTWSKHTASAAAIYYLNEAPGPGNFIEFGEIPNQAAEYKLVYEPSVVRPQAKQDTGFRLEQFDEMVAVRTALKALPRCKWKGLDKEETKARKAELRQSFAYELGSISERRGWLYLFWMYRQRSDAKVKPAALGFGEYRW